MLVVPLPLCLERLIRTTTGLWIQFQVPSFHCYCPGRLSLELPFFNLLLWASSSSLEPPASWCVKPLHSSLSLPGLADVQGMQRRLMFAAASSCQYLTCSLLVNTSTTDRREGWGSLFARLNSLKGQISQGTKRADLPVEWLSGRVAACFWSGQRLSAIIPVPDMTHMTSSCISTQRAALVADTFTALGRASRLFPAVVRDAAHVLLAHFVFFLFLFQTCCDR